MSTADIIDNKWELESIKPPIKTPAAIGQIALIGGLGLFFVYITIASVIAMVTPKKGGGLADQYKNLNAGAAAEQAEP